MNALVEHVFCRQHSTATLFTHDLTVAADQLTKNACLLNHFENRCSKIFQFPFEMDKIGRFGPMILAVFIMTSNISTEYVKD